MWVVRRSEWSFRILGLVTVLLLVAACGGQPSGAPATKPAAEAKPAAQAKPAAEAKPAAQAKPAAEAKPAAPPDLGVQRLAYGTGTSGSSHFVFHTAVANVLSSSVLPTTGIGDTSCDKVVQMLDRNELNLGQMCPTHAFKAFAGQDEWAGKAVPLRMLFNYTLSEQNIVVLDDSGIKNMSELTGKKFNPGPRATTTEVDTLEVLDALGLKPDLMRASVQDATSAMKNRQILGYAKGGVGFGLDATTLEIKATRPVRLLSFSDEEVAKVKAKVPRLAWASIPAGAAWKEAPAYRTWVNPVGVGAHKRMSEELAYRIVKAFYQNQESIGSAFAPIKGRNLTEMTMQYNPVPLHPGAVRYYKEIGAKIPDNLIPKD